MNLTITTYNDQQFNKKINFFKNIDIIDMMSDPKYVYDKGVQNTEEIYDERLRNKLSVLSNLIDMCKIKDINKYNLIKKCINDILNIKKC